MRRRWCFWLGRIGSWITKGRGASWAAWQRRSSRSAYIRAPITLWNLNRTGRLSWPIWPSGSIVGLADFCALRLGMVITFEPGSRFPFRTGQSSTRLALTGPVGPITESERKTDHDANEIEP